MIITFIASIQTLGADISERLSNIHAKCLFENGYHQIVVQAQYGSSINQEAIQNYEVATAAGIKRVDYYITPSTANDPVEQIRKTMDVLQSHNVIKTNSIVWLNVEDTDSYFGTQRENQVFILRLLEEISQHLGSERVGVYTSNQSWTTLVDPNWRDTIIYKLKYAHFDGVTDFDDFVSFGGWKKPSMKTFAGDVNECGMRINKEYQ
ncbi:Glycosyl_hydrolase family 25 protein [Hexamita inflata]|uniref:Glycosyl hydrolase family 25 protein n=1 Tax=Hexamita inflata TaxID=28002 RepID=A0AA86NEX3_9EUKA|nr:Glycosyl hydrolase family 25 protein [Hexamita inflata]CAI9945185.1 Glycosyl hydrolase family 25 protein [Hexamita inflata]